MMSALIPVSQINANLAQWNEDAKGALSDSTQRGSRVALRHLEEWCEREGVSHLPADPRTVAAFLRHWSGSRKVGTLRVWVSHIARHHRAAKLPNPCDSEAVRLALTAIAKERGTDQKQATGLNEAAVIRIETLAGRSLKELRDVALMRVGRDLLARAGELVSLTCEMISWEEDTVQVRLRRFKTSTQAESYLLGPDAAEALMTWLTHAGITFGPVWRSITKGGRLKDKPLGPRDVGRILEALGERAGLKRLSGHSLRVGMAQDLVSANFGTAAIMVAGGWASSQMIARYARKQRMKSGAIAQYYARRQR